MYISPQNAKNSTTFTRKVVLFLFDREIAPTGALQENYPIELPPRDEPPVADDPVDREMFNVRHHSGVALTGFSVANGTTADAAARTTP